MMNIEKRKTFPLFSKSQCVFDRCDFNVEEKRQSFNDNLHTPRANDDIQTQHNQHADLIILNWHSENPCSPNTKSFSCYASSVKISTSLFFCCLRLLSLLCRIRGIVFLSFELSFHCKRLCSIVERYLAAVFFVCRQRLHTFTSLSIQIACISDWNQMP